MQTINGIILLDKPQGISANQALQKVKRHLNANKAGHTGTLDPMATGMLPICLGRATRLCDYLLSGDKCYRTTLQLGCATDSGDAEGNVIQTQPVPPLNHADISAVLACFTGSIEQVPPMYSALKIQGKRLYQLARQGQTVTRQPRPVTIYTLELLNHTAESLELRVTCSKGTYIRVLGEDIAKALGTVGHLSALRREYCAGFESHPMVTLETLLENTNPQQFLLPTLKALQNWQKIDITAETLQALLQGKAVTLESTYCGQAALLVNQQLAAIAQLNQGKVIQRKMLL
jgi:tRNA pseudouridine55 synthase